MRTLVTSLCLVALLSAPALARIKLITLPVRERVEIRLDHENATLVEEERIVPLVAGDNQVDFSWANTLIDPQTIVFRVLGPVGEKDFDVNVLSVSYPPGENALVWQVSSAQSGPVRVRISYLLGRLTRSFNYRAVAGHDEKTLTLSQYVRVQNFANEDYSDSSIWMGFGHHTIKPVGINQTMEVLAQQYAQVPIVKTYTCNATEHGYIDQPKNKLRVLMHYVIGNTAENNLGQNALPPGKVRIYQEDGRGSTAFLGEDWGNLTPISDDMQLYLGMARDVVVTRTIESNTRERISGDLFDQHVIIKYEIENFKNDPVTLDVAEDVQAIRNQFVGNRGRNVQWELGPQTTFEGGVDPEETDINQVTLHAALPAAKDQKADKIVHKLHLIIKNEW